MLALEDKWIWDFWFAKDGDLWHVFFLQADKALGDPELRHWNVSYGHATSADLKSWTYLGTCFTPSESPAFDDKTTWTGSVLKGENGLWHLFYTGTSKAENGRRQRIGHAASTDLHNWTRVSADPILAFDPAVYEEDHNGPWDGRAMRDPWVIPDPDGTGWLMYFTARIPVGDELNARGAVGLARSDDLYTWTLHPPVFTGGFGQLEVPQVFERGGRWYCFFCTAAGHWSEDYTAGYPGTPVTGSHYLTAPHPLGPWTIPPGPYFDGNLPCRRYSGKIVEHDGGLYYLAFEFWDDAGAFIGRLSDPMPVEHDPATGHLSLKGR